MSISRYVSTVVAAICLIVTVTSATAQRELVVSSYLPEVLFNSQTAKAFGEMVTERTNGEITFRYYFNAALANERESLPMMSAGAIDIGFVAAAYYPADFPLTTLFDVPMLSQHMDATQRAVNILYEENPAFREEFESLNLIPLLITVADITPLGSNKRVESLDDVAGMRIRAIGALAQVVQAWGGTPISLGSTEIYQSMQAGLLDGFTAQPLQDYRAKSLDTVTEYAIDVGLGIYHTGFFAINKDTYESLSPEIQSILLEAAAEANALSNKTNMENTSAAIPLTIENGLELYSLSDDTKAAFRERALPVVKEGWLTQAEQAGIDRTEAEELLSRFEALTAEFDAEPDAQNYWEIFESGAWR